MSETETSSDEEDDSSEEEQEEQEFVSQVATQALIEEDSASESSCEQEAQSVKAPVKRKRKDKKTPAKRIKSNPESSNSIEPSTSAEKPLIEEKKHPKKDVEKKQKTTSGKKEPKMFNDKNCDIDLFDSDPDKIVNKKIRINSSLIMSCKTMEAVSGNGGQIEWAAILFEKKMKDGRSYDFNTSLACAPHLIEGLKAIMKANPKYFRATNVAPEN